MRQPELVLVVAAANNGAIGKNNQLIWKLPNDLKRFKSMTMGHPVLMGRNTFESIGKPLPGRRNVVVSSSMNPQQDVEVYPDLNQAMEALKDASLICVIGGGQIYQQLLPIANTIWLTRVDCDPEADTFFRFDSAEWELGSDEAHPADEKHDFPYRFQEWKRKAV